MRRLVHLLACLAALTINASATAATANATLHTIGVPTGFSELASPRVALVDVYFGGQKIAEAFALTKPGFLRFRSPGDLAARLPEIIAGPEVKSALEGDLPTNSQAICSASNASGCGILSPEVAGIIYDEGKFRVDLFVNPGFVRVAHDAQQAYLPTPSAAVSLTNSLGLNASGTFGGGSAYNVQNRTVIGFGSARVRANASFASHLGVLVDDFVGELDRKDLRYSAGLFWAPGNEFIGERRIIGAGVGTQFDTSTDRSSLQGTPLIVFLVQPARIEILVDGRLVSSRSYPAGNNDIDTSGLPEGSYSLVIRIHESNGSVRDEHRFFVKNAQIPPARHPLFYAYGGMLANTVRNRPISISKTFFYQAGVAWRLTNDFALDVAALGTQRKAIVEAGGWLVKGRARMRAAALASSSGDAGALIQFSLAGKGALSLSFDLRRIWSHDGNPLVPTAPYTNSFDVIAPTGLQLAAGSYTQATGSLGLRLGSGYLSLIGSYRKDRNSRADYTIGPNMNWPVATRRQVQIVFEASAQHSRTANAAFAGFRALFSSGRVSMMGRIGRGFQSEKDGAEQSTSRTLGNFSAQYSHETEDRTMINVESGFDRDNTSSTIHAGGRLEGRLGSLRGDVLHNLEGEGHTQYDLTFQSGMALSSHAAVWGGRDLEQSAIVVSVSGDAPGVAFDVLVDEVAKGRVKTGQRLALFVPGYRTYKVRLVPVTASPVSIESSAREVTLYPGNVRSLAWRAESYFTLFAQAVSSKGEAIPNALVQSTKGVAETDANGYFQIDARRDEPITIATAGPACRIRLGNVTVRNDLASVGKVICQ